MEPFDRLLLKNRAWAEEKRRVSPDYFERLSADQNPMMLWIGCADSRVAVDVITDTSPGDIFVHRNIANLVYETDPNVMSVITYAVEVLKVEHVVVCGHYNCGGIRAAASGRPPQGVIFEWLGSARDVLAANREEIDQIASEARRHERLVELVAIEQARKLSRIPVVQNAWRNGEGPVVHAWVFNMNNGVLEELESFSG